MPEPQLVAVSNTSPLQYLHQTQLLTLLPRLYQRVLAPPAVLDELDAGRMRGFGPPDVRALSWIEVVRPKSIAV